MLFSCAIAQNNGTDSFNPKFISHRGKRKKKINVLAVKPSPAPSRSPLVEATESQK